MRRRRKISACHNDFLKSLRRLRKLEEDSRNAFLANNMRPRNNSISTLQLEVIVGTVFFSAFLSYENLIEEVFLLLCLGKETDSGLKAVPYVLPRNYEHAAEMIKSSQPFLDWTSPDNIIKRSELFLSDGYPIKDIYTSNLDVLRKLKKIRNHFAHNSNESHAEYLKVVRSELGTLPPKHPRLGEFLLRRVPDPTGNLFIHSYLDAIERISHDICS